MSFLDDTIQASEEYKRLDAEAQEILYQADEYKRQLLEALIDILGAIKRAAISDPNQLAGRQKQEVDELEKLLRYAFEDDAAFAHTTLNAHFNDDYDDPALFISASNATIKDKTATVLLFPEELSKLGIDEW